MYGCGRRGVSDRSGGVGLVAPEGYLALLGAGRWAVVWFISARLLVPFDAANTAGLPLSEALRPEHLLGLVDALEGPKAWLLTAGVTLIIALGCRWTLRWQPVVGLLGLAIFALLPPLATGHASADVGHDVATAALMVHVPAAAVWIGLLAALIVHLWRGGRLAEIIARRYSRVAVVCWLLVAASGAAAGWWLVPRGQLVSTGYGKLLLAKVALLTVLGLIAAVLRRRALAHSGPSGRGRLLRLAAGELAVLLATLALSVGLTHLAPSTLVGRPVTGYQTLLGYNLSGPPTWHALVADWRIDVVFAPLALALAATYLVGLHRLRRRGERWPLGRTVAWLTGCLLLLLATSSGVGRYAPAMFSMHIASHMLTSMLVPVLLVLGGPLTLAGQALAPSTSRFAAAHEWLQTLGGSRLIGVLTHPVAALVVFAGAPFVLYFASLFDVAMRFHWAHQAITACFLGIGYLFAWVVIGVDPVPRPMPNLARVGVLLAAMPADAVFTAAIMNTHRVIGNGAAAANVYSALDLPWVPDLLADQFTGGVIALIISEVALLVALGALVLRWWRLDEDTDSGLGDHIALTAVPQHAAVTPAEVAGGVSLPNVRSRRLLDTTNSDDNAIAAAAISGLSRPHAATGNAATL